MKNAFDTKNGANRTPRTADAIVVFTVMLLFALIVGVPVWYVFGIDFFKVLVVSLALATLFSLVQVLEAGWFELPLLIMILGLIVAVPVGIVFGSTGFFAVFAVFFVLGIMIPFLMGKEGREEVRRNWKKRRKDRERKDREQEDQRQQQARLRQTEQERLKREQDARRSYAPGRKDGGGGRTAPLQSLESRAMLYKQYLQTPHWKRKRDEKLRAASYRCQMCSSSLGTLNVHHNTYDRLGKELDGDLIVLCRECHRTFHEHRRLSR